MWRYLLRRLLQMVPVLLIVTFLVHGLMHAIPGDPARALVGPGESLDEEQLELIRREHNLDKPILVQYAIWLGKALRGDLGRSTQNQRPVVEELGTRAAVTLQFGVVAWIMAVLIAVPAGIASAVYRGRPIDYIATVLSIGGVAIPNFWLGIMAILLFGVTLGWLPTQGLRRHLRRPGRRHPLHDPAGVRARHHELRTHHAPEPLGDARGPRPGLRAHCPCERTARAGGHLAACAAATPSCPS